MAKFSNVVVSNTVGIEYPYDIIKDMKLRYIANIPFIPSVIDYSLDGKAYITEAKISDKRYIKALNNIRNVIFNRA